MEFPKRKQIRLSGYDYSGNGYYFITICTQDRKCILGNIVDNKMVLNNIGKIVENVWETLPQHHPVELDTFQIMPNHIHFIIVGVGRDRPVYNGRYRPVYNGRAQYESVGCNITGASRRAPTLGFVVGMFKTECTKQIRRLIGNSNFIMWQRNYYEHVIRDEDELFKIQEYINSNPLMWEQDKNNPIIG